MRLLVDAFARTSADGSNRLGVVTAMVLVGAFMQVSVLPRLDLGLFQATPNLVVAVVVAVALLRGVVVGAVAGFAGGILVELLSPGETLGVIALVLVVIGAWCGRFASGTAPVARWFALGLMAAATLLVPLWLGLVQLLRGDGPPLGYLLGDVAVPQLVVSPLVAFPVWWLARRLLGAPRAVEPWTPRMI